MINQSEILVRDSNRSPAMGAVVDTENPNDRYIIGLRIDPVTKRLYVDATAKLQETSPVDPSKVNASLVISNVDMVQASTKTITKTIGSTNYQKTLSLNAKGDTIGVSAWSIV